MSEPSSLGRETGMNLLSQSVVCGKGNLSICHLSLVVKSMTAKSRHHQYSSLLLMPVPKADLDLELL